MFCPRLTHNIRLSENIGFQVCGHMVNSPVFDTVENLKNSIWLKNLSDSFFNDQWPDECVRCKEIENLNQKSVRQHAIEAHKKYFNLNPNYLFVTGLLDNVCNSACISCSKYCSTYIGKLTNDVVKINNSSKFDQLTIDQILVFEITGGEPTHSKLYKEKLMSLTNVKYVRINTNVSKFMTEIVSLLERNIDVTITFSIDGVGSVFEYIRWPLKWSTTLKVIGKYKDLQKRFENLKLNIWTTVSALNINDFENIKNFSNQLDIPMSYGLVHSPAELSIKYKNDFTLTAKQTLLEFENLLAVDDDNSLLLHKFIKHQDQIRNIDINNFIKLKEK